MLFRSPKVPEVLKLQLTIGGRLVIPVGRGAHQTLLLVRRVDDDEFEEEDHGAVTFVPLIGAEGWAEPEEAKRETAIDAERPGFAAGLLMPAQRPRAIRTRLSHLIAEAAEPFGDLNELTRLAERFASLSASIEAVLNYLDKVDPESARIARERYGCLAPWRSDPVRYGRMALSRGYAVCEKPVADALLDLLKKRLDYLIKDGEAFFSAEQNAHRHGGRAILPGDVLRRCRVVEFARPAYVRHAGAAASASRARLEGRGLGA